MNKITQTIMESLNEWKSKEKFICIKEENGMKLLDAAESVELREDFFLQSQIKVIEAVTEELKEQIKIQKEIMEAHDVAPFDWHEGQIQALEDQISSLNETLEFLKKSL